MQEQTAIVVLRNKQNYKDTPYRDEGVWGCFLYISYFIQPNGTFLNVELRTVPGTVQEMNQKKC